MAATEGHSKSEFLVMRKKKTPLNEIFSELVNAAKYFHYSERSLQYPEDVLASPREPPLAGAPVDNLPDIFDIGRFPIQVLQWCEPDF